MDTSPAAWAWSEASRDLDRSRTLLLGLVGGVASSGAGVGFRTRCCRRSLRLRVKSVDVVAVPEELLDLREVLLRVNAELPADELHRDELAMLVSGTGMSKSSS